MSTANPSIRSDTDDVLGRARGDLTVPNHTLLTRLLRTSGRLAPTVARLGLGLVILPHALQKMFGWFGGHGFSNTYHSFHHGQKGGEGFELHLLAIPLGVVVLLAGGGRVSVDRAYMRRRPMVGGSVDERFVNP